MKISNYKDLEKLGFIFTEDNHLISLTLDENKLSVLTDGFISDSAECDYASQYTNNGTDLHELMCIFDDKYWIPYTDWKFLEDNYKKVYRFGYINGIRDPLHLTKRVGFDMGNKLPDYAMWAEGEKNIK